MKKKPTTQSKWLFLLWTILAAYHLFMLSYSPVPWFDETFFASISRSVMEGDGLMLKAAPFYTQNKPVLIYGPVYFWLQAAIMSILDFSEWAFRLLNLVAAAGIIVFVNFVLKSRVSSTIRVPVLLLLAFDTIFAQNAHSGRMDMLTLLLVLCSYLPIFKSQTNAQHLSLSAAFALTALLTSPRIAIFLLPLCFWLLYILVKEKKVLSVLAFGTVLLGGYFCWIIVGFGGIRDFFLYYSRSSLTLSNGNLFQAFVGGNFNIRPYQLPLIVFTIVTFFVAKRKWSWLTLICIINIIVFYLLVKDTGIYSALIIPFWLMLLAENMVSIEISSKIRMVPFLIIGSISVGIFLVKTVVVLGDLGKRNPSNMSAWVKQNIPSGSHVVGEYKYYYAVTKNNSDFQFLSLGGKVSDRAAYHLNFYNADYILVSEETKKKTIQAYLMTIGPYEKSTIHLKSSEGFVSNLINKLIAKFKIEFSDGYEGEMYKRIR